MLDYLRSTLKVEYKPGPGAFLEIDDQKLIAKLKLKERGTERGAKGQPATDSDLLDEVEQEIVNAIRTVATEAHGRSLDQISTYAQRLRSADISGAAAEMKALARQSEGDFEAEVLAARGDLEKAKAGVTARSRDVTDFRSRHQLKREPNPPKDHIWLAALLFIMFGIEVVPNAMILAEGEELGFIGGITQALIYSFLNIGFGFVSGLLAWTHAIHRNPAKKMLGILVAVAIGGMIFGLNLALAHYRTGAQTMPSAQAVEYAWRQLLSDPFAISDLKSAGMVAMGGLFSFLAMIEGFIWRDPYPGYAAVSSHLHQAEGHFHDMVDEKIDYLKRVQGRFIGEIKNERSKLRDKRQEIPLVLEERRRLVSRFDSHVAHLQDVARSLLAAYRGANLAARENPGPKRFQEGDYHLDGFERIELDDGIWQQPESEWAEANQALEASVDRLQSAFEGALNWIRKQGDTEQGAADAPQA